MVAHSRYGFSSSDRWMKCPASIRMSAGLPNPSNDAAALGTAVHSVGELCIAMGINPKDCIGLTFNGIVIDDRASDGALLYKNVANNITLQTGVKPLLEQRVTMSSLGRTDVFGTSDLVFLVLHQRKLIIGDYKNGYGYVDVNDNSQLAGYGVATLDTFNFWDLVDTVECVIVQPNYDHVEGPVRTVSYTIAEMRQWQQRYAEAVRRADDPNEKPVAGEHCHYCLAQANCRARMEYTLKSAYTDVPLYEISIGELEQIYEESASVKRFLDAVGERILREARDGKKFVNYKLVETYDRASVDDEPGLIAEAKKHGVDPLKLYLNPRLKGKTEAKKLLPLAVVNKFYKAPPPTTTVVHITNNRPEVRVGKADGVFTPIEQPRPSVDGVFGSLV